MAGDSKLSGVARAKHSRNLLVWLHVLTSVAWMSQALALCTLLLVGVGSDAEVRLSAFSMAEVLDERLLAHLANASAFTGLMLSGLTPWGYFRYWWVLVKFVITITQLYVGIFVLGPNLAVTVHAAESGHDGPAVPMILASLLMASAIAFQAYLSVAKPWKWTPWANSPDKRRKLPSAPAWMFVAATVVPIVDFLVGALVFGFPLPALSLLVVIGYPIRRKRGIVANDRGQRGVPAQRTHVP